MSVHVWTCVTVRDWWLPLSKAHTAHLLDNDFSWWLHQVRTLEEMGRRMKRRRRGGEGWGWRGWGTSWDLIKCSSLPNLPLYSEKQQEGCRRQEDAADRWADVRALTALMNEISTLAKWLHHRGSDRGQRKQAKTLHYWGTIALTKWAFCHGVTFVQQCSTSSGWMSVLITTKNSISSRHN